MSSLVLPISVFKDLEWSEVSNVGTYIQNIGASILKLFKTRWKEWRLL